MCTLYIKTDYKNLVSDLLYLHTLYSVSCSSLEQELEELEKDVSATSTKENLSDADQQEETKPDENMVSLMSSQLK